MVKMDEENKNETEKTEEMENIEEALRSPHKFVLKFENAYFKKILPKLSKKHTYLIIPSKEVFHIFMMITSTVDNAIRKHKDETYYKSESLIKCVQEVKREQILKENGEPLLEKDTSYIDCNSYLALNRKQLNEQLNPEPIKVTIDPRLCEEMIQKIKESHVVTQRDKDNINFDYFKELMNNETDDCKRIEGLMVSDDETNKESIHLKPDETLIEENDTDKENENNGPK